VAVAGGGMLGKDAGGDEGECGEVYEKLTHTTYTSADARNASQVAVSSRFRARISGD
jgi:hypothetical protein